MNKLCDFEFEVLESLAGLKPPVPWGAALGAALGFLKGRGYVEAVFIAGDGKHYRISQAGMDLLKGT